MSNVFVDHWDPEVYSKNSDMQYDTSIKIINDLNIADPDKILDIGCGDGKITVYLAHKYPKAKVVGLDASANMIRYAKHKFAYINNLVFLNTNVLDANFVSEFDLVVSFWALSWVKNHELMLCKVINFLKPNGTLGLIVPLNNSLLAESLEKTCGSNKWSAKFKNMQLPKNNINLRSYREILEKNNFQQITIENKNISYTFDSVDHFKGYIKGWLPLLQYIDLHQADDFVSDIANCYLALNNEGQNNPLLVTFTCLFITNKHGNTYSTQNLYWEKLGNQFNLQKNLSHLALCMINPHPEPVRKAISRHRDGFDSNPTIYYRNKDKMIANVLTSAATYLQADPNEIALTESTTMGLSVVYTGLKLSPGDEIITTTHDHYASDQTLHNKAETSGAILRKISLYDITTSITVNSIVKKILSAISPKTRVLALTWVHSCTGVKLPLKEIAQNIQDINLNRRTEDKIIICVDAVHALGVEYIENVASLGCDFIISGCHKWLFGPRGTGIVWGSKLGWSRISPIIVSFDIEAFLPWRKKEYENCKPPAARLCSPGGFTAYEHRWALAEAFSWHIEIGPEKISNRIVELNNICKAQLSNLQEIKLHTPIDPEFSAGLICFDVASLDPTDVVERLLRNDVITGQTPYRNSSVRVALGILNSEAEINRLVKELKIIIKQG